MGKKKIFKITDEEIKRMYLDGNSMSDIAKIAQDTKGLMALRQKLIDMGVDTTLNMKKYQFKFSKAFKKYKFNENYFDIIDCEHKAYWFGFLMADGYNHESKTVVCLRLKYNDLEILEKMKMDLEYTGPIYEINRIVNGAQRKYCELNLCSVIFSRQLAELGCTQGKTYTIEFPNNIPEPLIHHFIRGYFDGDGCISITKRYDRKNPTSKMYQFNIVGRKEFIAIVKKHICKNTGVKNTTFNTTKNSYAQAIHWSGKNVVTKILNYLYKDATIYLKRKHDKYLELIVPR